MEDDRLVEEAVEDEIAVKNEPGACGDERTLHQSTVDAAVVAPAEARSCSYCLVRLECFQARRGDTSRGMGPLRLSGRRTDLRTLMVVRKTVHLNGKRRCASPNTRKEAGSAVEANRDEIRPRYGQEGL